MSVATIKVSLPLLSQFVDCIYEFGEPTAEPGTIMPEGKWDLIFNLGLPGSFVCADKGFDLKRVVVTGLHDRALQVKPGPELKAIGVKFKPFGLYPFLRIPMRQIAGSVVDADDVFDSRELSDTYDQLLDAENFSKRSKIIELFLLRHLRAAADHRVLSTIKNVESENGMVGIRDLATSANLSDRRLGAIFSEQVGVAPKKFARITRFVSVIRQLRTEPKSCSLTQLGYDHRFSDQSHFIRDFKSIAGMPPRVWLAQQEVSEKYNF